MKKYILLILPFLLTGCLGVNNNFTTKCTFVASNMGFNDTTTLLVHYNHKDKVNNVVITRKLKSTDETGDITLKTAKESAQDQKATDSKVKGLTITENSQNRTYKLIYNINISKASNSTLNKLKIKTNINKYKESLKQNGYDCQNVN